MESKNVRRRNHLSLLNITSAMLKQTDLAVCTLRPTSIRVFRNVFRNASHASQIQTDWTIADKNKNKPWLSTMSRQVSRFICYLFSWECKMIPQSHWSKTDINTRGLKTNSHVKQLSHAVHHDHDYRYYQRIGKHTYSWSFTFNHVTSNLLTTATTHPLSPTPELSVTLTKLNKVE